MANEIWNYISRAEYECQHCHRLPPGLVRNDEGGWPLIYEYLFTRFADIREAWGEAIPITSGYRCKDHPLPWGTHMFGLAIDCGIGLDEMDRFVDTVNLTHPELRMGTNRRPGSVHVHLDCGYLIHPIYSANLVEGLRFEE